MQPHRKDSLAVLIETQHLKRVKKMSKQKILKWRDCTVKYMKETKHLETINLHLKQLTIWWVVQVLFKSFVDFKESLS